MQLANKNKYLPVKTILNLVDMLPNNLKKGILQNWATKLWYYRNNYFKTLNQNFSVNKYTLIYCPELHSFLIPAIPKNDTVYSYIDLKM